MTTEYLPDIYVSFRERFPEAAAILDSLGAATERGPMDERTRRLVKLGVAVGAQAEGAVRSNARKARAMGIPADEILQVALLAVNTRGFPAAVAALAWMEEVLSAPSD